MHDPREGHMQAIDKILPYLKSSLRNGLFFRKGDTLTLKIYILMQTMQVLLLTENLHLGNVCFLEKV